MKGMEVDKQKRREAERQSVTLRMNLKRGSLRSSSFLSRYSGILDRTLRTG